MNIYIIDLKGILYEYNNVFSVTLAHHHFHYDLLCIDFVKDDKEHRIYFPIESIRTVEIIF